MEKAKKLFEISIIGTLHTVSATTPAKARKWVNGQIEVREIGAVEAMGMDKSKVHQAE